MAQRRWQKQSAFYDTLCDQPSTFRLSDVGLFALHRNLLPANVPPDCIGPAVHAPANRCLESNAACKDAIHLITRQAKFPNDKRVGW